MDFLDIDIFSNYDAIDGAGLYSGIGDGVGGVDIFHNGSIIDHYKANGLHDGNGATEFKFDNQLGGIDTYNNGTLTTHTVANMHGGMDVYSGTKLLEQTVPNIEGGFDAFDSDMHQVGKAIPNMFDSLDYWSYKGNASEIMNFDNPLAHVNEYNMPHFDMR